jgi:hypothetical protein
MVTRVTAPHTGRFRWSDPRWLLIGLAVATIVFLVALSHHGKSSPPPPELPPVPAQLVKLGRPSPTAAKVPVGQYLRIDLHPAPGERYGFVQSGADVHNPLLYSTSTPADAPMFRTLRTGTVLLTVLLEPHCPSEGICREYRRNLGAVRVTVTS